jgi:hypothetical protein
MPYLIGLFRHRDANILLLRVDLVEKTKIDRSRRLGKDGEVDSIPQPGRA